MKRVRVDEFHAASVAAVFGVAAIFTAASPTGASSTDAVVVAASVTFVAWAAASSPWWVLGGAGAVATIFGFGPVPIVAGSIGALIAFVVGTGRADMALARTVSAGCTLLGLCTLQLDGFFALTSVIGITTALLIVGAGLARRRRRIRRRVVQGGLVVCGLVVLSAGGLALAAAQARGDLVNGEEYFETAVRRTRDGDTVAASEAFSEAADRFDDARSAINRPWAQPARLVPVLAQHRRVASVAASTGHKASRDLGLVAAILDVDALRPSAGRFDVDAFTLLATPVAEARNTLHDVGNQIDDVRSPWLTGPVQAALDTAETTFDDNIGTFDQLAAAIDRVPDLLGANDPRHYFVAFTTPAEARGLGGFMGNYAVLTADDGAVSLSDFGRTVDLNRGFGQRRVEAPDDWLDNWGPYGFTNGADGATGATPWSNITMSAHFPSTAQAISSLFPQSGGIAIDGVIAMDPYVLEAFVNETGPISVTTERPADETDGEPETDTVVEATVLDGSSTARFLLFDQYLIEQNQRVDALEQVAATAMAELFNGALPDPLALADSLGPSVDAGRLVAWMNEPDDQHLMESLGIDGALPALDGGDGFMVIVNNAGANKLDAFLSRSFEYSAEYTTTADGTAVDATLDVVLSSSAPSSGLPDGVIGNYVGDPIGTNRSLLSVYSAAPVEHVTVNGQRAAAEHGIESGWHLTTVVVVTAPGGTTSVDFSIVGGLESLGASAQSSDSTGLVVRTQPLVDEPATAITATADGEIVVEHEDPIIGTWRWPGGSSQGNGGPSD